MHHYAHKKRIEPIKLPAHTSPPCLSEELTAMSNYNRRVTSRVQGPPVSSQDGDWATVTQCHRFVLKRNAVYGTTAALSALKEYSPVSE